MSNYQPLSKPDGQLAMLCAVCGGLLTTAEWQRGTCEPCAAQRLVPDPQSLRETPTPFEMLLGYFAGAFFYNALSTTVNLFEGLRQLDQRFAQWWDEEDTAGVLTQRFDRWIPEYNELIEWTLEEVLPDSDQITDEEAAALYRAFEEIGHALLDRYIRALGEIAVEAYALYPSAGHTMGVYYIFCGWLWRTLTEVERFVQDPRLRGTRLQRHYGEHAATVQRLIMLLRREEDVFRMQHHASNIDRRVLHPSIEERLIALAAEWPEAVCAAAHDWSGTESPSNT